MPDLVLENVPPRVIEELQRLAEQSRQSPAEAAVEWLTRTLLHGEVNAQAHTGPPRLPDPPFLTDEGPAPFDIPRPNGVRVKARLAGPKMPELHDFPDK